MTEKSEGKVDSLPDLDDLLQCPVCYEIPSGQIFQCNEGHHVCGRCKMRLDVCPVCRAFFFGTRNYAMEELIDSVKKLRAFKLGGKVTTGSPPAEVTPEAPVESSSEENESSHENVIEEDDASSRTSTRVPVACKGLFRCLCCKSNPERLPLGRLLNHLRYYHSPDLIEARSENDGYLQAWQFPTAPGRMVTAVRVHDMGIFFLVIEITHESVHAWMSMAASPWVAHEFSYSFTLSGNDREAIFSDCVWSVRSCEGSLKRRGRCLSVTGTDARALLTPTAMNGKLSVRRTPHELQPQTTQPRAVLRVANRSAGAPPADVAHDLEPFLQDLQNDVARLSRAFATLGREANALVRTEAEMRARLDNAPERPAAAPHPAAAPRPVAAAQQLQLENAENGIEMTRSARRRMRQRLRVAFRESPASEQATSADAALHPSPSPAAAQRPAPAPAQRPAPAPVAAQRPSPAPVAAPRPPPSPAAAPRPGPAVRPAAAPPLTAVASAPVAAPRPAPARNASEYRHYLLDTGNIIRPASNQIFNRPQNNDARLNTRQPMSANTARVNGPNSNPTPTRANNAQNSRAANEPVVHIGYLQVASPPPPATREPVPAMVPPPAFGGPSQSRPADGNGRNKKKRRQRR